MTHELNLNPLHRRVAGIDVHRMLHVVTLLVEQPDGSLHKSTREFGGFKRDCRALAQWLHDEHIELAVMESTGIYCKSLYAHLEQHDVPCWVVNARAVKHVPGRKSDVLDSEWLATLARFGLVRASFIPPKDLRELRLLSRYRSKLSALLAGQTNRLHKLLEDAGIKLGAVVSDLNGVSGREIVNGLIKGQPPQALLGHTRGALKRKHEALMASMQGELSARHVLVLGLVLGQIESMEKDLAQLDAALVQAMQPYARVHALLQTLPGIDIIAAAQLVAEMGVDMARFGSAQRLAAWSGLSPGVNESAGKRRPTGTGKGNPLLRHLLCECAHAASRTKSSLASKFKSLVVRKSYKKSIVALAHKMLRVIFAMVIKDKPYEDPGIDYAALSAKKNAPRWIRQLIKIGALQQPAQAPATN